MVTFTNPLPTTNEALMNGAQDDPYTPPTTPAAVLAFCRCWDDHDGSLLLPLLLQLQTVWWCIARYYHSTSTSPLQQLDNASKLYVMIVKQDHRHTIFYGAFNSVVPTPASCHDVVTAQHHHHHPQICIVYCCSKEPISLTRTENIIGMLMHMQSMWGSPSETSPNNY